MKKERVYESIKYVLDGKGFNHVAEMYGVSTSTIRAECITLLRRVYCAAARKNDKERFEGKSYYDITDARKNKDFWLNEIEKYKIFCAAENAGIEALQEKIKEMIYASIAESRVDRDDARLMLGRILRVL